MSTGKIILGVVSGLAAGAALGILFAPDKGSNTRKKISKSGENLLDDMKGKFDSFLDSAKEKLAFAKEEADQLADNGKAKVKEVKNDVKNAIA